MLEESTSTQIVVDATGQRLGRMASKVAKLLLSGVEVIIVNAEKAIITGSKKAVLKRYLRLMGRRQLTSHKVVKVWYPRRPDRIVWYTIARMLPRKKPRGREAVKRLKVYVGVPKELENIEKISFKDAELGRGVTKSGKIIRYMTIKEVSNIISGGRFSD